MGVSISSVCRSHVERRGYRHREPLAPSVNTAPPAGQGSSESPLYTNLQELKLSQSSLPPHPSSPPLHILGEWETHKEAGGRHFYYNRATQERTWKPPRARDTGSGSRGDLHTPGDSEPLSSEENYTSAYSSQSDSQYGSPPSGWSEELDAYGHTLYVCEYTNEKWMKHVDEQGRQYYYSADGSRSEWELPKYALLPMQSGEPSKTRSLDRRPGEPIILSKWRHSTCVLETNEKDSPTGKPGSPDSDSCPSSPKSPSSPSEKCGVLNVTKITEHGRRVRKNWTSSWTVLKGSSLLFAKGQGGGTSWEKGAEPAITGVEEASVGVRSFSVVASQSQSLRWISGGGSVEWASKDKSSKKNVIELKTRQGTELLVQSDIDSVIGDWYNALTETISAHGAWESDEAIEEDMPESPGPENKEKERRDSKKSRAMKSSASVDSSDQKKTRHKLKKFLTRRPTLQSVKDKGYIKDQVFGGSLASLCQCEDVTVPKFVRMCIDHVENNGLGVDGLYRVSGNLAVIQKLRFAVNHDEKVNLEDSKWEDIHVTTGALKMFFRELPEPLFTFGYFDDFMSAIKSFDKKQRLHSVKELIKQLPKPNHDTMQVLFKHLRNVIDHGEENRMTAQSLAIVFGPTLLRPEVESMSMAVHMMYQNHLVEHVLLEYENIFGRGEEVLTGGKLQKWGPHYSRADNSKRRHFRTSEDDICLPLSVFWELIQALEITCLVRVEKKTPDQHQSSSPDIILPSQLQCRAPPVWRETKVSGGKVSMLSAFISPFSYFSPGEDEDHLSTSSTEVKENRDFGNIEDCALAPRRRQPSWCSNTPSGETSCVNRKRPLEEGNWQACRRRSWRATQKNAVEQLNELRPGLRYDVVSQTGPVHAPLFTVRVEVNGLAFQGEGPTKKKAKMRAAELALKSFVQFPNASQAHLALGAAGDPAPDFTSDQEGFPETLFKGFEPLLLGNSLAGPVARCHGRPACHALDLMRIPVFKPARCRTAPPSGRGKTPVVLLNELRPGLRYACLAGGGARGRSFVMAVRVDGRIFEGSGRSKKLAKCQAAQSALWTLFGTRLAPERITCPAPSRRKGLLLPQDLADWIFRLVTEKYQDLAQNCTPLHARQKVLAGIVMTRGLDIRQAQVVALSTGTKCINGEYMSDQGLVVNDSHAEIIARRALIRFLYSQLEQLVSKEDGECQRSIFVQQKEAGYRLREAGYRLRDGVLFHMYISMSPCGDARLNCPYEIPADPYRGQRFVRRFHSRLRTKIESGEGTLPVHAHGTAQAWDAVLQGEQLVTLSCTDKIARWNVLGVQGSLLSHFLEPVYLSSLTVGSLHHTGHLARTVAHRLDHIGHLPAPYRHNQPLLGCLGSSDGRWAGKSPCFSVNWTAGDAQLEVVNASTGRRRDSGASSRLCKHALFTRWARLHSKIGANLPSSAGTPLMYCEVKQAAGTYQSAKRRLVKSLQEAGLGTWIRKPLEQEQFLLKARAGRGRAWNPPSGKEKIAGVMIAMATAVVPYTRPCSTAFLLLVPHSDFL
ncbi:hypothetical protein SKAU_G00378550 [Synaphobranchus kaupii]|uniref:Uncharacterized protein n=1 Tax=Synaphobranchus kaupii TaxID=118154 RepID=A0A9Q1ED68_SYNKA|nr:hypothetical protein SKAU_G00378550 [Synaphobranchus kaupii]